MQYPSSFLLLVLLYLQVHSYNSKMESEIRHSFSLQVQSAALVSKYERRVRDHMRSYRIGVMSKDLEKMTDDHKSHRNMIDRLDDSIGA